MTERERDRETDRQTDRDRDRETEKQKERQRQRVNRESVFFISNSHQCPQPPLDPHHSLE